MANTVLVKETPIHVGDTVKVYYKIIEHETEAGKTKRETKEKVRERFQPYEGIVIAIRGKDENKSFTVRRIGVDNVGIERIFPVISPWIQKVVVKKQGLVKRAKLYYLRNLKGTNLIKTIKTVKKEQKPKSQSKTKSVSAKPAGAQPKKQSTTS